MGSLFQLFQGRNRVFQEFGCRPLFGLYGFPAGTSGKEPACLCRRRRRPRFDPWVRKIPWRRKWQPTPVFLPGRFHGQRSLAGYSPRGRKESDMTEHTVLGNGQPQNCRGAAGRALHHMLRYYNEHTVRLRVCRESHLLPSWV